MPVPKVSVLERVDIRKLKLKLYFLDSVCVDPIDLEPRPHESYDRASSSFPLFLMQ